MEARKSKSWYPDEDAQLIREHKHNKYAVEKMALLHKRPLEEITRRLRRLGLVKAPLIDTTKAEVAEILNDMVAAIESIGPVLEPEVTALEPEVTVLEAEPEVTFLMNISDYTKAGDPWSLAESDRLKTLYHDKRLGLMTISALHLRTPSSIICKLRKMDIEKDQASVRGFLEYKGSALYKEVCLLKKQKKQK
jgi:hypothetical protein